MANNRLYIVDTETKERFLLAKGFGSWQLPAMHEPTAVFDWLAEHDMGGACSIGGPTTLRLMTENEVDAMDKAAPTPEWRIEYNNDTGPDDGGFWEWWTVTDGARSFKCDSEEEADFLIAKLRD